MKLICMFGQRKYDESVIELMVAWDEYCVEENEVAFERECEASRQSWGESLGQWRIVEVQVSENELRRQFVAPTMKGTIKDEQCGNT